MKWSPQQDGALRQVAAWIAAPYRDEEQIFYMAGYAGTGKTTLAKHLASGVDGQVIFVAFTGKATHVLRRKGCGDCRTIHSLIYITHDRSPAEILRLEGKLRELRAVVQTIEAQETRDAVDENRRRGLLREISQIEASLAVEKREAKKPMFRLNPESEAAQAALIVVDEASMVDERMAIDLMSFKTKILVMGDPAQLPPVGGYGYFTSRRPNILLTEIHRQAQESPILRLATAAREHRYIGVGKVGDSDDCEVINNHPGLLDRVMAADQVLVGKNKTRHASNDRCREVLRQRGQLTPGGWMPVVGDKLVCLRNDHEIGLLNGSLWRVLDASFDADADSLGLVITSLEDGGSGDLCVPAHTHYFQGRENELPFWKRIDAQEFDYGYALTVHKSQGSQWDDVVLFDQSSVFREDRWKWLYTGITRAARRLLVVR